jgi:serine/threonine protein kinase
LARTPLRQTDPAQVGRYRLVARLGAGGMGVVYLGEAPDGRQVAVKVLRPELADNPEFQARFGREVSALTRVQGVCTVRVIEADTQAHEPFLVTEYADGPSLSEYVDARGPLDPSMLYGLATGLAEALATIHAAGIVHRDLKPSNVLLTASGPKVIDFGIAQALDTTSLTRTGITVGSAGFMAPEQITGRAGTAADIFTWAVTVAYAASGQSPFGSGASDAILYRIVHEAPDISAVPPGLRPLVEAALAKDPAARPAAPQLLAQLTHDASRYENPTRTILAQTWHPTAPRPAVPPTSVPRAVVPPTPAPAAYPTPAPGGYPTSGPGAYPTSAPGGPTRPPGSSRRRKALLPVVLALAFVLAAGGTALGLALAGGSSGPPSASGSTSTPQTHPAQITPAATQTPQTTPATSYSTTASAPTSSAAASTAPASTPTSPASTATALPVLAAGSYSGTQPTEIAYSGDSTNVVTTITWTSWTATGATGQGTSDIDSCVPNCAAAPPSYVPTTVTLSAPVNGKFTQMTETRNGSTTTYTYPGNWAQSAS